MTDTPDLRTLAAEAIRHGDHALADDGECGRREDQLAVVDAVLAAVLPAHRRQVLGEAERVLRQRADSVPWSDPTLRRGIQYAAATVAMLTRDSTSAAPETAPTPRQDDETAPAVPEEAAETQRPAEGASRVPLAEVLAVLRELDPTEAALAGQGAFLMAADILAERFATAPQGADEGNDRG